jgi:threonine dehydrogenase-like Zn-dependent dehydrogenase
MRTSRAVVQTAPRTLELRDLPIPDVTDETAVLRVEACGICGSDVEQYQGVIPAQLPLVPGHEPLGVIEKIGDRAARRWGVDVGDRVAVETLIPCGHCPACRGGRYQVCRGRGGMFAHGYVPLSRAPGLWGAYADYMHLDPFSILHKMRKDLPASLAVMFNPLGAGFRWAVELPRTGPGDAVLVLGPGQRGLASVIAARAAGADTIIVTGLTRDAPKLALAREFGADGITANTVAPGAIDTIRDWSQYSHQEKSKLEAEIPSGRYGKTEEVAAACAFLCADTGAFVSGQAIHVNGGHYMY